MRDLEKIQERTVYEIEGRKLARLAGLAVVLVVVAFYGGVQVGKVAVRADLEAEALAEPTPLLLSVDSSDDGEPKSKAVHYEYPTLLTGPTRAAEAPSPGGPPTAGLLPTAIGLRADSPDDEPFAAPDIAKATEGATALYTLQVKAFRDGTQAERLAGQLRKSGYDAYVVASEIPDRGRWHRVRLGRFDTLKSATEFQGTFESHEGFSTLVSPL